MSHVCTMYPDDDTWDAIGEAIDERRPPPWPETALHLEPQDTSLPGWQALLELVDLAARDGREVFAPKQELGPELWQDVITLPPSIATLKGVKKLDLYRSHLLRLPPEIGGMERLVQFIPYTSYGLHWFPYEITHCRKLRASTVSTRALYGNRKYRPPFPSLDSVVPELVPAVCSVCGQPLDASSVEQVWISLGVGTDVLPLLVNACSPACVASLPAPAEGYVPVPHKGGPALVQPLADD